MTQTQSTTGKTRRTHFLVGAAGLAIVTAIIGVTAVQASKIDLVEGVEPMSRSMASISTTIDRLAELQPEQRGAYLEQTWPHLDEDVVFFLRAQNRIPADTPVSRVEFKFGDLDNIWAQEAGGERRFGYVEDQLVAVIQVAGVEKPIVVLVQCLNGTFMELDRVNDLQSVGTHTPIERFVIGPREGLVHHVDYPAAIALAEEHRLPVYKTSVQIPSNRISYATARAMESQTDWTQVTVRVFPGDEFNLVNGTYTSANRG